MGRERHGEKKKVGLVLGLAKLTRTQDHFFGDGVFHWRREKKKKISDQQKNKRWAGLEVQNDEERENFLDSEVR